jgi:hypothetical protein
MKICPAGAELFHPDGQMEGRIDTTNLIVAFRDFSNAPKNSTFCPQSVLMCFTGILVPTETISVFPFPAWSL